MAPARRYCATQRAQHLAASALAQAIAKARQLIVEVDDVAAPVEIQVKRNIHRCARFEVPLLTCPHNFKRGAGDGCPPDSTIFATGFRSYCISGVSEEVGTSCSFESSDELSGPPGQGVFGAFGTFA